MTLPLSAQATPATADPSTPLETRSVLNLGCGRKHMPDAVNVDAVPSVGPDVVHDLNQRPWPFPGGRFTEVHMYDVIEHLDDVVKTMEEIHRVCRHHAVVHITVPHFSSANAFTDPTHRHYFASRTFHYVTGEHDFSFYTQARFSRRASEIVFRPSLLNKLVWRLARRYPDRYERRWAWIFPAWFLYFELEVLKPGTSSSDV
jgi:SAM-dependent methyltransferase